MALYKFRGDNGLNGSGEIDQIIYMVEELFGLHGDVSNLVRNMNYDHPVKLTGCDYIHDDGEFTGITIYKVW